MPVPLLDINRQHEPLMEELRAVLDRALDSSRFVKGPELEALEEELASYCGVEYAVGCASGTDALILSLMAIGVSGGDLVLTTPFTFFATAGAVVRAGGTPVFLDISPATYNMAPEQLDGWLDSRCVVTDRGVVDRVTGRRVAAILPVHLFGQVADMDAIGGTASDWGLPVVEDACQAIGASWRGEPAGSLGAAGCFSFFPSKNLGALGDAGLVTTPSEVVRERLVRLREHGGSGYLHSEVGFNSRMDAIQAGFLRVKLPALEGWHEGRRRNAAYYDEALADLEQVATPVMDRRADPVYNQYTIRAEDRDGLLAHLRERGIGCSVYYPLPLHLQECFSDLGYGSGDMPESERASAEVLSLPVFGELTEAELEEVVGALRSFYG